LTNIFKRYGKHFFAFFTVVIVVIPNHEVAVFIITAGKAFMSKKISLNLNQQLSKIMAWLEPPEAVSFIIPNMRKTFAQAYRHHGGQVTNPKNQGWFSNSNDQETAL
jgi:hypothetical protein